MIKKALPILMAGCVLAASLAGCSGNDNSNTSKDISSEDFEFTSYPVEAKDVKLTLWFGQGPTLNESFADYTESPFHMGLSDMTGVTLEWQFPTAGTDGRQAFNLMLASETLPDIIFHDVMADAQRLMDEGVIRDLTDYMAENSPAYYKHLKSNELYDKYMKTDSGQYYGYGFFREDGGWNDTYQGPLVRKDWLDALNLELPKTVSDWDKTLRAFKEEYNAVFTAPWSRMKQGGISGAFGAYGSSDLVYFIDKNQKVQLGQAQEEWKDYLAQLNAWWEEGLIDQDLMVNDDAGVRTKVLNGVSGLAYSSMGQSTNWINDAKEAGNGAEWAGLQYPTGDNGTLSMVFGGPGIGNTAAVITSTCSDEKLPYAMRVLDYAYTEEGFLYWNFGKQGESWEYDADGEPDYTDVVKNDPEGLNNAITKYAGSVWNGPCIQATKLLYLKNSPEAIASNDTWFYPNEEVTSYWKFPSGVTLTTEEANTLDEYNSSISTYVSEMCVKYITGQESLDNFDQYLEQLNKMNLQKVLETRQIAYDRFLAR